MLIAIEASVIFGLLAGLLVATLGASPLAAVCAGGATIAACFGIAMGAATYVTKQSN
ncbi:hypothetical protein HHX38_29195 [Streptomyces sp. PKU-MA01144]|uniref:hypothetical protein n=1 Tax=Streptomyces sp. PKU-MA01144 TaxID=2729138 RepID=UPI00147C46BD|nr:hypothetical protein [Streptomyces sp. PKU-MA01144]NNJ08165.1 hypothetical protein [Streptomyces sp. PKU-MA01144]